MPTWHWHRQDARRLPSPKAWSLGSSDLAFSMLPDLIAQPGQKLALLRQQRLARAWGFAG